MECKNDISKQKRRQSQSFKVRSNNNIVNKIEEYGQVKASANRNTVDCKTSKTTLQERKRKRHQTADPNPSAHTQFFTVKKEPATAKTATAPG